MAPDPIKRDPSLLLFSRDHHHSLLLGWKVRAGLKFQIELDRIKKYIDWFWEENLKEHFEQEEKYIFTILSENDSLRIQAFKEHHEIEQLFHTTDNLAQNFDLLQEVLTNHVRFEERILFNKIQEIATEEQLQIIAEKHKHAFVDNWPDEFWVKK